MARQIARKQLLHIGFIVEDVYESVSAFLENYGIGPWLVFEHYPIKDIEYRGAATSLDITAAIAYYGSTMIELIQQHDDSPSAYKETIAARGFGFHHFAFLSDDFDGDLARYKALGLPVVNQAAAPPEHEGAGRAAYIDTTAKLPGMTEITERDPNILVMMRELETIAASWDGSDPIRIQRSGQ